MFQTLLAIAMAQAIPTTTTATVETKVVVPYNSLDLGSVAGRKSLDRRILSAARRACDEQRLPSAAQQARIAACVADSRVRARRDVDQALARRATPEAVAVASSSNPATM